MLRQPKQKIYFYKKRTTSDGLEVRDEAQYILVDSLTIKHVHLKTGTLAFLIQHCYGTRCFGWCDITINCLPSEMRPKQLKAQTEE